MPILTNLQAWRLKRFLTIEALAEQAHISVSTVKSALKGTNVSFASHAKMAKALECKKEDLI